MKGVSGLSKHLFERDISLTHLYPNEGRIRVIEASLEKDISLNRLRTCDSFSRQLFRCFTPFPNQHTQNRCWIISNQMI